MHGIIRRSSSFNTGRIDHLPFERFRDTRALTLHYSDLSDGSSIVKVLAEVERDEVYNLGAQSHVGVSFDSPEYTAEISGLGALRILEGINFLGLKKCRYYQASTSELFGGQDYKAQNESTPFYPRSPYAVAKLFAYWTTVNYREAHGIFACNGILFNHESPRRGATFVTRKITRGISRIICGLEDCLYLGNFDALRDWGHAKDYVEMQWLMLQQRHPKDYVIATGIQTSVREFLELVLKYLEIEISWIGQGLEEYARVVSARGRSRSLKPGSVLIRIDPRYYRPTEVNYLLGDATLAKTELG